MAEGGTVTAAGGKHCSYEPWQLDDGTLTLLGFRHQVPTQHAEETWTEGRRRRAWRLAPRPLDCDPAERLRL